jgi:hypothetical protein
MKLSAGVVIFTAILLAAAALTAAYSISKASRPTAPSTNLSTAATPATPVYSIEAAANVFKVENLAVIPPEVNADVDAIITARVTNTSQTGQKYEGQVRLDNISEPALPTFLACQLIDIGPGDTKVVSVPATINSPGNYKVTLGGITQNLVVDPINTGTSSSQVVTQAGPIPAIDFAGVDVVTGKTISLKSYRGKAILLNFVNYGCNPSVNDVVSKQLLTIKKLKDQGIDFVPVSVFCGCCPPDVLKQFAKDNNLNWPWILDSNNSIVAKYGNYVQRYGYPALVYINAQFSISETGGSVAQSALADKLNNLVLNTSNLK